jgi:phage-related protein
MKRQQDRPLVWLHGEIRTPPFSVRARVEVGVLLRKLQRGDRPGMPHVRPMPVIGPRGFEARVSDSGKSWRVILRIDADAIVIAEVFQKTTRKTPLHVIRECIRRLRAYDQVTARDQ